MSRTCLTLVVLTILLGPLAVAYVIGTEDESAQVPGRTAAATVRNFGAMGDGRVDDTAAIQKAVDAGIGEIRFPPGVYRITKPIVIHLRKVGWTSVIGSGTARIVMAGPGPAFKFVGTHAGTADPSAVKLDVWHRQRMPVVDGIEIVGNTFWKGYQYDLRIEDSRNVVVGPNVFDRNPNYWDPDGGNNALLFRNCQDATLNGLHINGATGMDAGLMLEDCHRINVTNCTILDCAGGGLLMKNVSGSRVSDCLIRNDLPEKKSWLPVKTLGSQDNMVVDNLLDEP